MMRHLAEYVRDGVTVCRGVLNSSEVQAIKEEVEILSAQPSCLSVTHRDRGDPGCFFIDILLYRRSPLLLKLALESPLSSLARFFLPTGEVFFFYDQLFIKEPLTKTRTQWHQDLPFWPLSGAEIPSLWLALTQCDERTSSVIYIPGSHRGPVYSASNHEERHSDLSQGIKICPDFHDDNLHPHKPLVHSLNPGDVVVHHPLVVHGAGPNLGTERRLALSLRYCSSNVRWQPRERTMHFPGTESILPGTSLSNQNVFLPISN